MKQKPRIPLCESQEFVRDKRRPVRSRVQPCRTAAKAPRL